MVNETGNGVVGVLNTYLPQIQDRLVELIKAPAINPEMLWIVTPLVIATLLMTFYFGRYLKEEIGWNTAVGNSLVLVFVSIDLFRYIYTNPHLELIVGWIPTKTIVAILVALEGFTLLYADFFHFLPEKIAFFISSALPVNLTAYVAIAIVYSNIPFNLITIASALVLFFILLGIFEAVKYIERNVLSKKSEEKPIKK